MIIDPSLSLMSMLSYLRRIKYQWTKKIWFNKWLAEQSRRQTDVDSSVDLCGLVKPYKFISIGSRCSIGCYVSIYFPSNPETHGSLTVGNQSFIGRNTMLGLFDSITIGENVQIAPYCFIIAGNHRFDRRDIPISEQGHTVAPIAIEDDVWIGAHVTVLPGITIGEGAIIGASSVVNRDIPAYQIWAGVPARYIKDRP